MSQCKLVDLCLGCLRKPSLHLQPSGWFGWDLAMISLCLPEQNLLLSNPCLSQSYDMESWSNTSCESEYGQNLFLYKVCINEIIRTNFTQISSALTPSDLQCIVFPLFFVSLPWHHVISQAPLCPPTHSFPFPCASNSHLPLSQCDRSFSLHLPPTPFMLQIAAACCHDVKLVAPRLAGMASFSWWHNVLVMSYALKQWSDVTAVSASLSNAGNGCHVPAGNMLSDKLMSAAQLPCRHKKFLASHTVMNVLLNLQKLYYINV